MSFNQFYESTFRKSKHVTHLVDLPMFSIFISNAIANNNLDTDKYISMIKIAVDYTRQQLGKMGFPSMHANVVIADITGDHPLTPGVMIPAVAYGTPGSAEYPRSRKQIFINYKLLELNRPDVQAFVNSTLLHEWAHIYLFNKADEFYGAVQTILEQQYKVSFKQLVNLSIPQLNNINNNPNVPRQYIEDDFQLYVTNNIANLVYDRAANNQICDKNEIYTLLLNYFRGKFKLYKIRISKDDEENIKLISTKFTPWIYNTCQGVVDEMKKSGEELSLANFSKYTKTVARKNIKPNAYIFPVVVALLQYHKFNMEMGGKNDALRNLAATISKWPTDYGLYNPDELWATAIEHFFQLPPQQRKQVVNLISQYR